MSSRHRLRRNWRTALGAAAVALTLLALMAGLLTIQALNRGNDPGHICRPLPGTSRLDCG